MDLRHREAGGADRGVALGAGLLSLPRHMAAAVFAGSAAVAAFQLPVLEVGNAVLVQHIEAGEGLLDYLRHFDPGSVGAGSGMVYHFLKWRINPIV